MTTGSNDDILVKHQKTYEFLKKVRESKTVTLKATPMLRSEVVGLDGLLQPFRLRYYQIQAIYHLLAMRRFVLSDACGSGKTIVAIASYCYAWQKEPMNKVIVVAPKSALRQWRAEVYRFTTGIKVYLVEGEPGERKKTYERFLKHPIGENEQKAILLIGYASLVRDWNTGATRPLKADGQPNLKIPLSPGLLNKITQDIPNLSVTFDEAVAFKNMRTKTWQVCRELADRAHRCYGMTATLLKNNLIEGFCIYKCIYPSVFSTKTKFLDFFCVTRMQPVARGRKIPIILGYKNLEIFRQRIDPFFLGRPKHLISDELPKLITREVLVELSSEEEAKYNEALTGILTLGDGEVRDYSEHKRLVALTYCQQAVDSLFLLRYKEGDVFEFDPFLEEQIEVGLSSKEQALMDLLTEEFDSEKVIVYTRFASLIPRLQSLCKKANIKSTAITGKVVDTKNNPARQRAMESFQNLESDTRVIFISDAGSEAINLQAAEVLIAYNAPWSWGSYVQLIGRPIRIGSPHQHVVAIHLVAEHSEKEKTIDHYTLEILQRKKKLIDAVLGESAIGALDFESEGSFTFELMKSLRSGVDKKTTS